jgi:hypothetical protein
MRLSALSATGGPGRAAPDPRARPLPSVLSEDPTTVHQDKTMRVYQTGAGPLAPLGGAVLGDRHARRSLSPRRSRTIATA